MMAPGTYSSLCLLAFFTSLPFLRAVEADTCPRQWLKYQGNCYGFFHKKLSWHEAEIDCQSYGRGAHLASILAWPETLIVSKHILAYKREAGVDVWIGLHDTRHPSEGFSGCFEARSGFRQKLDLISERLGKPLDSFLVASRATRGTNGNWRWTDGSAYNYENWMRGEPNNLWNSEYCVALRASTEYKGWVDAVCKKAKAYICKHEL